jgi:hypothetical protein
MRIKSYFAHSVQAAISLARHEFGDNVTLVTSHVAAPDARHLGEYEVVFAVDAPAAVVAEETAIVAASTEESEPAPKFTAFQEVLLEAVAKKPAGREVLEQIDSVRATLIQLGVEPSMVRALMTLVERSIDATIVPAAGDNTGTMLSQLTDSLTATAEEPFVPAVQPESFEVACGHDTAHPPEKAAFPVAAVSNVASGAAPLSAGSAAKAMPSAVVAPHPRLTSAELAFAMSISEGSDAGPLLTL